MGSINLDEPTHALVRFAARLFSLSEAEVVGRAVREYAREVEESPRPGSDRWMPVDIYGEYRGQRVEEQYLPATRRITITSEPLGGTAYQSPSGAARAAVAALNPKRGAPQANGWRFWHLGETGERLEVLR